MTGRTGGCGCAGGGRTSVTGTTGGCGCAGDGRAPVTGTAAVGMAAVGTAAVGTAARAELVTGPLAPGRWGVLLVRHGESVWNVARRVQGQAPAPGLTPRGRAQVAGLAAAVAGLGVGAVVSSDLRRARESAALVADALGLDVVVDRRWRERALGAAEGRPAPVPALWSGVAGERVVDPDAAPPGGESIRRLTDRVVAALAALTVRPAVPVLVVTHGGVLRVALGLDAAPGSAAPGGTPPTRWPALENAALVGIDPPAQDAADGVGRSAGGQPADLPTAG